jgi:hypothetical protein
MSSLEMMIEFFLEDTKHLQKDVTSRIPRISRVGFPLRMEPESLDTPVDAGIQALRAEPARLGPAARDVEPPVSGSRNLSDGACPG